MGHSRFVGRRSHAAAALLFQEEVARKEKSVVKRLRRLVQGPGGIMCRH